MKSLRQKNLFLQIYHDSEKFFIFISPNTLFHNGEFRCLLRNILILQTYITILKKILIYFTK